MKFFQVPLWFSVVLGEPLCNKKTITQRRKTEKTQRTTEKTSTHSHFLNLLLPGESS